MADGLGFGRRKLIHEIIMKNWETEPNKKTYNFQELLFVVQELLTQEGKPYFDKTVSRRGFRVFDDFVKHLMYRNIANFDSMILMESEKGCITDDSLIDMPRDLIKYPKGIPVKELIDKGKIHVYSFNKKTKQIEVKLSDGVVFAKYDDIYELELTNGQKIKATSDHPFMLMDGSYKQLKDLIWLKGKKKLFYCKYIDGKNCFYKSDRLRIFGRGNPFSQEDSMIKIDYNGGRNKIKEHVFIYESIYGNRGQNIIHHIDGNHYNNKIENLQLISRKNHSKLHGEKKISLTNKQNVFMKFDSIKYNSNYVRCGGVIKSIKHLGKQNVYDVVNVRDNHNFIANGFIISNTGKSSAAIMLGRQWCKLLGIRFNPNRHMAYSNADVMNKIDILHPFEPLICDESINFCSSENWAKAENKELKKKLAQVRTKHLLFVLCFPLKIYKVDKTYLESFVNYWVSIFSRGNGAIFVKDKNPVRDSWRMTEFKNVGSYTEFTNAHQIHEKLKKHPNYWQLIKFPKPPDWLYTRYLKVREANVYDDANVMKNVSKEDIHKALLILSLRDIIMHDSTLSVNKIILHIKNEYDINLGKSMVENAIADSKQLIAKIREQIATAK